MPGKGTQLKKSNIFYYKLLEKGWGFYNLSIYMFLNCTSFYILMPKFIHSYVNV